MLMALFDGGIERLELAADAFRREDRMTALRMLTRAEVIVCELAGGVDPSYVHAAAILRLYNLASRAISASTLAETEAALRILRTLRGGIARIREDAVQLELRGELPPVRAESIVSTIA
jgi:flagellin-specific chaperone FliS